MNFRIVISASRVPIVIPINYQYPLSAAIYKIIHNADKQYAAFLHETGYGKGFKLFCFSDLRGKFSVEGDRLNLLGDTVSFEISFYLPEASQHFIKGLFMSQQIEIADKKSSAAFTVQRVEALANPFHVKRDNEIIDANFEMASACVVGIKNEKGNYEFLNPEDPRFAGSLLYNWKEKIKSVFPGVDVEQQVLSLEASYFSKPPKSRLMTVKAGTPEETKIRGFTNFGLKVIGEKRFVELLWNCGVGLYNALGCGCVEVVEN